MEKKCEGIEEEEKFSRRFEDDSLKGLQRVTRAEDRANDESKPVEGRRRGRGGEVW